ncbi:MAG: preprotein translocase subunit SecE [Candidatus Magasanikbacteria bacterium CG_4_10_14_0_2_um_filter_37_12]|uniref:Protein translocase subunit SecE n=1 Tax=Candidatus Magasanikbacteria bacterium CG_4_10_14_0_2_um_filter_37_12 TaxID=1974637 RepID=A0A2M7V6E7_9BACT|nr:MAG: preprotein translocase subunit SecE [Candidatus Magasanikbacteria bacterium CG_4_10_14_0_2_um_filter_37_12]
MKKIINYVKESISELKKVVWPTKKQTVTYSIVVVAMSIGVAIFFAILDYFFSRGIAILIG